MMKLHLEGIYENKNIEKTYIVVKYGSFTSFLFFFFEPYFSYFYILLISLAKLRTKRSSSQVSASIRIDLSSFSKLKKKNCRSRF